MVSFNVVSQNIEELSMETKGVIWNYIKEELSNSLNIYYTSPLLEQENYMFKDAQDLNFKIIDQNSFHKIILYLFGLLSEVLPEINNQEFDFKKIKGEELEINYLDICAIIKFIKYIIEKNKRDANALFKFYSESKLPKFSHKNNEIEKNILKLMENTKNIKILNICLSNKNYVNPIENKSKINLAVIQLFCYFLGAIFTNALVINLDLNVYEINRCYSNRLNPYLIKEDNILEKAELYKEIFFGNLIFMKRLTELSKLNEINFKMYDSYQIELHQLMTKYLLNDSLDKSDKNIIKSNNKYAHKYRNSFPFFQHILSNKGNIFYKFNIKFNALDPLLFSYVNIVLVNYESLANISLSFFNFDKISPRKILINSYYYNYYSDGKKNPLIPKFCPERTNIKWDNDSKIYYGSIKNLKDFENKNMILLKDEVVLKELFPYFDYNLKSLLAIIEKKMQNKNIIINCLKLDFTISDNGNLDLNLYNNYNSSIICFLYNFFCILDANKEMIKIAELIILLDDFTDEKQYIVDSIKTRFPNNTSFNLNKIGTSQFTINLPNISLILPFHNFPMEGLTFLSINNLSFIDLNNLLQTLIEHKKLFPKLTSLIIGLNYMLEDFLPVIKKILKEYIFKKIMEFKLIIPSYISYDDIIDIVSNAKRSKNNESVFTFKLSNEKLSPNNDKQSSFLDELDIFRKYSKKKWQKMNIISEITIEEKNKFVISMETLDKNDINYYLSFIHCFNKIYNKNGNKKLDENQNKKIFENIFYYMGKFRKDSKKIFIDII